MSHPVPHLVVIGVGLIGGSVARALRRAGFAGRITGVGRSPENLELAVQLGVIDDWSQEVAAAVRDADAVVVAVPMGRYDEVFAAMAGHLPAHAVVTDAGSTKQHALEVAGRTLVDPSCFVGAHPLAGTEQSGVGASFVDLFEDRPCIITPDAGCSVAALQRVKALWQATGSQVMEMSAAEHDKFLAAVSHLPHLTAFALVNAVRKQGDDAHDPFRFAAGGFRDFTRIASSSPEMWRDIALCNHEALLAQLQALESELTGLRQALETGDGERLLQAFTAAKDSRDQWLATHGGSL